MQHLALVHQVRDRTSHVLDRHLRVDAVLIEQVHPVGTEALQRPFHGPTDAGGIAGHAAAELAGLGVDVETELGRDLDLVAEARHRLAEDALALEGSVDFGAVEEGDALVEGGADQRDHVSPFRDDRVEGAVHVLHAQAQLGDLQAAEHPGAGGRGGVAGLGSLRGDARDAEGDRRGGHGGAGEDGAADGVDLFVVVGHLVPFEAG